MEKRDFFPHWHRYFSAHPTCNTHTHTHTHTQFSTTWKNTLENKNPSSNWPWSWGWWEETKNIHYEGSCWTTENFWLNVVGTDFQMFQSWKQKEEDRMKSLKSERYSQNWKVIFRFWWVIGAYLLHPGLPYFGKHPCKVCYREVWTELHKLLLWNCGRERLLKYYRHLPYWVQNPCHKT